MGKFTDRIKDLFSLKPKALAETKIVMIERGSSGTELYSGVYSTDHLNDFNTVQKQETYRQMERDPQINMLLKAIKDSIMSAQWDIRIPEDSPKNMDKMREFVEFVLFEDMKPNWQNFLHEVTTYISRGFALFEKIHKNGQSKEFGQYTGLGKLAFREQNTIEYWNLDREGKIITVDQYAYGDLDKGTVKIPGEFIVVFTNRKIGDNYEGESELRASYGPWFRKNLYYKLQGIGIEKMAIGTVIGTTPTTVQPLSEDEQRFENTLKEYTSHEKQYILKPKGWEIEIKEGKFNSDHVVAAIQQEDTSMAKSLLANFLELGVSSQTGSFALGNDLSDFFLATIQHFADEICEVFNREIIPELINLNFGPQAEYPYLQASGITDKAGMELANILNILSTSGALKPDDDLETHIRERYRLPPKMEVEEEDIEPEPQGPENDNEADSESEDEEDIEAVDNTDSMSLAESPRKLITQSTDELEKLMREKTKVMGDKLVNDLMRAYKNSTPATKRTAHKNVKVGATRQFKDSLTSAMYKIATKALESARKEVPNGDKVKLAEGDNLGKKQKKKIKDQSDLLVDTLANDIWNATLLTFTTQVDKTEDEGIIRHETQQASDKFVQSSTIQKAASVQAAKAVNEMRSYFFLESDAADEIESFTFKNPNPVTAICQELNGRTFLASDSASLANTPPLHYNCKSYLSVNLKGDKNPDPTPGGLTSVSPNAVKSKNLDETLK